MAKYSRKAGDSKYPIEAGHVIQLNEKRVRSNKKISINERRSHTVFVWVMRIEKSKKHIQPKYRKVRVAMYYLPAKPFGHNEYFMEEKKIQFEWLTKLMQGGFKIVAKGIKYDGKLGSVKQFYVTIGAL